jgi:chromosome segregation ATPase
VIENWNLKEWAYGLGLAVIGIATGLGKFNKEKSTVDRAINEDRNAERKSDMTVEETAALLTQMRIERAELTRQRDAAQEQSQAAWAQQIKEAPRIANVEAENKFLKHELANAQTSLGLVQEQNERMREDMRSMREELRRMRSQIEEMTVRYGSKPQPRVRTDFGSLDDEPGQ